MSDTLKISGESLDLECSYYGPENVQSMDIEYKDDSGNWIQPSQNDQFITKINMFVLIEFVLFE